MKYDKTKLIVYTDKKIIDEWNEEHECVYNAYNLLMFALDKRLQRKNDIAEDKAGHPFINKEETNYETLMKYLPILINDSINKIELNKDEWNLGYIKQDINDDFIHKNVSKANTVIYQIENNKHALTSKAIARNKAIAEAEAERKEKEQLLKKAKELAKAELLREQEELEEIRLFEEAESNSDDIVIPLKNYGK